MHYRNNILSDQVKCSSESQIELKIPAIPENPIFLCFEMCSICITGGYPKINFYKEKLSSCGNALLYHFISNQFSKKMGTLKISLLVTVS